MKKIIFILMLLSAPVFAADDMPKTSLFFTPSEAHRAEQCAAQQSPGQGDIRLGAVMYVAPQDWVLWLQGEKWTPDTRRDALHIIKVTPNEVTLSWRDDEKNETKIITLHPNESYQIASGKIILSP